MDDLSDFGLNSFQLDFGLDSFEAPLVLPTVVVTAPAGAGASDALMDYLRDQADAAWMAMIAALTGNHDAIDGGDGDQGADTCDGSDGGATGEQFPENVDASDLRNAADGLRDVIDGMIGNEFENTGNVNQEYGAFILQRPDGSLLSLAVVTSPQLADGTYQGGSLDVGALLGTLMTPSFLGGGTIVGFIHSHTSDTSIFPSGGPSQPDLPNGGDWEFVDALTNGSIPLPNGIMVDPNLVSYIVTTDGELHEYTINDRDATTPGVNIGDDGQTTC